MAISNHERVGRALELLKAGLGPFVERVFRDLQGLLIVSFAGTRLKNGARGLRLQALGVKLGTAPGPILTLGWPGGSASI